MKNSIRLLIFLLLALCLVPSSLNAQIFNPRRVISDSVIDISKSQYAGLMEQSIQIFERRYAGIIAENKAAFKKLPIDFDLVVMDTSSYKSFVIVAKDGDQTVNQMLQKSPSEVDPREVSGLLWQTINTIHGFPLVKARKKPQLRAFWNIGSYAPLALNPWTSSAVDLKVLPNSNLLIASNSHLIELNKNGKVIRYLGLDWLLSNQYTANRLAVSPSGTITVKSNIDSTGYIQIPGSIGFKPINFELGTVREFIALNDGSQLLRDYTGATALRFVSFRSNRLKLNPSNVSNTATLLVSRGIGDTIDIFDTISQLKYSLTLDGNVLDVVPVLGPQTKTAVQFMTLPDGSSLFLDGSNAGRYDINGNLLWNLSTSDLPLSSTFPYSGLVDFDPEHGLLYFGTQTKEVTQFIDLAWRDEHAISNDNSDVLPNLHAKLIQNGSDEKVLFDLSRAYAKLESWELENDINKRLYSLNPSLPNVQNYLEVSQGRLLLEQLQRAEEDTYQKLTGLGPESARPSYSLTLRTYEYYLSKFPPTSALLEQRKKLVGAMRLAESSLEADQVLPLTVELVKAESMFPALYASYAKQPVGVLRIKNPAQISAQELTVKVILPGFSTIPWEHRFSTSLEAGKSIELPFGMILSPDVLGISEDVAAQASVQLSWKQGSTQRSTERAVPLLLRRNTAMTWDKSAKLASFVTPNDEIVGSFILRALSDIDKQGKQSQLELDALANFSPRLARAIALFSVLSDYGIRYLEDPQSPITKILGKAEVIDTVRLPRSTLMFRSGDCDDSTVLLMSLFEAIGIKTAIMTSPGHVFLAIDSGESSDFAWVFQQIAEVIISENRVWIPLESTELLKGFKSAWQSAAQLVGKYKQSDALEFIPLANARNEYPAIPMTYGRSLDTELPLYKEYADQLKSEAIAVYKAVHDSAIATRSASMAKSGRSRINTLNQLGVLEARFEKISEAERYFKLAMSEDSAHLAAPINLANLYLSVNRLDEASVLLSTVLKQRPDTESALSLLAQVYHAQGKTADAKLAYERLLALKSNLAGDLAFLSSPNQPQISSQGEGTTRASNQGKQLQLYWQTGP